MGEQNIKTMVNISDQVIAKIKKERCHFYDSLCSNDSHLLFICYRMLNLNSLSVERSSLGDRIACFQ